MYVLALCKMMHHTDLHDTPKASVYEGALKGG
jgi:hypothetical protein